MGKIVGRFFIPKITPEMRTQFEEAAKRPIVFDEDMPELTAEDFARFHSVNKRPKKAVGPKSGHEKRIGLVLESDAVEHLRKSGDGWQT